MGLIQRDLEEKISEKADELAEERCGRPFSDLPSSLQMQVWMDAEEEAKNDQASQDDFRYDRMRDASIFNRGNGHKPMTTCPECNDELAHFSGLENIPEYQYCPKCNDKAYNEEGEFIFLLV